MNCPHNKMKEALSSAEIFLKVARSATFKNISILGISEG